jgi:hypothetical protein
MSTSISGVESVSGGAPGFDPAKGASQIASRMMRELDTDKSGTIDKKEFVSGLVAKGSSAEEAGKQFDAIDTKKTGTIDKADIESALKAGQLKPPAGGRPPGGAGHAGGAGAAGGGSSKTYDPADTNEDGKVSIQESLVYDLSHQAQLGTTNTDAAKLGTNVDEKV